VILLLNGAFGIGKTTVARLLVARLENAVLFDPEPIGVVLQRISRAEDFQDLRSWRRLTVAGLRLTRLVYRNIVVPMAFSNPEYLRQIHDALSRFEPRVLHVCLVAPLEEVYTRLRGRGTDCGEWELRRAAECCEMHVRDEFARHVSAAGRTPEAIADELLAAAME
jgi:hypothetical protein